MGILSHFKKKEEKHKSTGTNVVQASDLESGETQSKSDEGLVLIWLGESDLAPVISEIIFVNYSFERTYKAINELIKKYKLIKSSPLYLRQLLEIVTERVFQRIPQEPFECEPSYEFMEQYLEALYCICTENDVDFENFFAIIKDLPISVSGCETDLDVYPWSFGDFTPILYRNHSHLAIQSLEVEDAVETLNHLFLDFFEEFLENASPSDIDELYEFGVKYNDYIDSMFEVVSDAIEQNSFKTPHTAFPTISTADALAENYPSLTSEIYTYYIKYILNFVIEVSSRGDLTPQSYALVSKNLIDAFLTIAELKEYRSEEFLELKSSWEWILTVVLTSFDGSILNYTIDLLHNTLKIPMKDIMNQVISFFSSYIYNSNGEYKVLSADSIETIARFLTNKDVFDYVLNNKPSVIEALS